MKKQERQRKKLIKRSRRVLRLFYTRTYSPLERAMRKSLTGNVYAFGAYHYEPRWRKVQQAKYQEARHDS